MSSYRDFWCYQLMEEGTTLYYEPRILAGWLGGVCEEHGETPLTCYSDPAMDSPANGAVMFCAQCLSNCFGHEVGYYTQTLRPEYEVRGLPEAAAQHIVNSILATWLTAELMA